MQHSHVALAMCDCRFREFTCGPCTHVVKVITHKKNTLHTYITIQVNCTIYQSDTSYVCSLAIIGPVAVLQLQQYQKKKKKAKTKAKKTAENVATGSVGTAALKEKDVHSSINDSLGSAAGEDRSLVATKSLPNSDYNAGEAMVSPWSMNVLYLYWLLR